MSGLLRVDGSGLDAVTHLALLGVESVRNGVLGVLKVYFIYFDDCEAVKPVQVFIAFFII